MLRGVILKHATFLSVWGLRVLELVEGLQLGFRLQGMMFGDTVLPAFTPDMSVTHVFQSMYMSAYARRRNKHL